MKDLLLYCDPMIFCPALHSVVIQEGEEAVSNDHSVLESRLLSFFGHCSHLEGARFIGLSQSRQDLEEAWVSYNSILFTSLSNQLQDNTLKKLDINLVYTDEVVFHEIEHLLSKHMESLNELELGRNVYTHVLTYLIHSRHMLRALIIRSPNMPYSNLPLLLKYLSLAGMSLEILCYKYCDMYLELSDELLLSIGASCPTLESLLLDKESVIVLNPSLIYHLCPNFKELSSLHFNLEVDEEKNSAHLEMTVSQHQGFVEDCMECLCLVLQRGQYHQVGLTVSGYLKEDEWVIVKTKVGAKLTSLDAKMSEDVLIELLRDLPRLQVLNVSPSEENILSVESLLMIAEHGQNLIELTFRYNNKYNFTDDMISHMIRRCRKLEVLSIPCAGCESILCAAQHLPRLREVTFGRVGMSKEAIMDLLDNEEVRWPSSLRCGLVKSKDEFNFLYEARSSRWLQLSVDECGKAVAGWKDYREADDEFFVECVVLPAIAKNKSNPLTG
eukprot:scaffold190_cov173-Ochromonas_danica.AAC.2